MLVLGLNSLRSLGTLSGSVPPMAAAAAGGVVTSAVAWHLTAVEQYPPTVLVLLPVNA
jgi:hypothetical protein